MSSELTRSKKIKMILLGRLFKFIISLFGLTCRKRVFGQKYLDELREKGQNWIYSAWHNNVAVGVWVLRRQKLAIMVSSSKDGEMITQAIHALGNRTVRGSSTRGGMKAFMGLLKDIKKGQSAAVTPDGPTGPLYKLQNGIISMAQKTGVPLIPFHVEATDQWVFEKSWDKHRLIKPFSTVVMGYGKPFYVPSKMTENELENIRQEFEEQMMENVEKVQAEVQSLQKK